MKKQTSIIWIIIIILGVIFIINRYPNILQLGAINYEYVYKQNWGHICCVQEFDYDIIVDYNIPENTEKTIYCNDYTNECLIEITGKYNGYYFINDGSRITIRPPTSVKINVGQSITIKPSSQLFTDNSYQVLKKAKSFYIKGQENGFVYRQESCILNSELKSRVLSDGLNELSKSGANSCQNYMIDFIQTATETYTYSGQQVVCQARQIYSIENKVFKDGNVAKIQGNKIANVDCCPAEANCNKDTFKFIENNIRECDLTSQCPNGGNPIAETGTSYIKWTCDSGKCINSSSISMECANNAICIEKYGEGYVCDLSSLNWGNCKKQTANTGYCGDGKCESIISETTITCPDDCGDKGEKESDTCEFWQEEIQIGKPVYKWYNYIGIGKPTPAVSGCTTAPWVYLVIAGGIAIVIIYISKNKRRKR